MRILHTTPYFAPAFVYGGPPRSVLGLCQALGRIGADVEVLTTDANGDREIAPDIVARGEFDGVAVRYLPRAWPRVYFGARGVTAAVDRLAGTLDVVHLHGCWNVFNWLVARACRRRRVPYVVSSPRHAQCLVVRAQRPEEADCLLAGRAADAAGRVRPARDERG